MDEQLKKSFIEKLLKLGKGYLLTTGGTALLSALLGCNPVEGAYAGNNLYILAQMIKAWRKRNGRK